MGTERKKTGMKRESKERTRRGKSPKREGDREGTCSASSLMEKKLVKAAPLQGRKTTNSQKGKDNDLKKELKDVEDQS